MAEGHVDRRESGPHVPLVDLNAATHVKLTTLPDDRMVRKSGDGWVAFVAQKASRRIRRLGRNRARFVKGMRIMEVV
jgi:hypothetical protein